MGARNVDPVNGGGDWICTKPDHWLYEGTGMKQGERIPGLIGWEYHGDPPQDIEGFGNCRRGNGAARWRESATLDGDDLSRTERQLCLQRVDDLVVPRFGQSAGSPIALVALVPSARTRCTSPADDAESAPSRTFVVRIQSPTGCCAEADRSRKSGIVGSRCAQNASIQCPAIKLIVSQSERIALQCLIHSNNSPNRCSSAPCGRRRFWFVC